MGKWEKLIHRLGGVTKEEALAMAENSFRMGKLSMRTEKIEKSIEFYANQKPDQEDTEIAKRAVFQAMAVQMEERGLLRWRLECLPNQDGERVKKFRMRGAISALNHEE